MGWSDCVQLHKKEQKAAWPAEAACSTTHRLGHRVCHMTAHLVAVCDDQKAQVIALAQA